MVESWRLQHERFGESKVGVSFFFLPPVSEGAERALKRHADP
jgi:hypothetical protein